MTSGAYFHRIEALSHITSARGYLALWDDDRQLKLPSAQPKAQTLMALAAALGHVVMAGAWLPDAEQQITVNRIRTPMDALHLIDQVDAAAQSIPLPPVGPGYTVAGEVGGFTARPSDAHQAAEYDAAVATMAAPHLRSSR